VRHLIPSLFDVQSQAGGDEQNQRFYLSENFVGLTPDDVARNKYLLQIRSGGGITLGRGCVLCLIAWLVAP
jgi:hypothetical protein